MVDRQWFVLYVLICLEVGVFLVFVPWSAIWERNYFLENYPRLRPILLSPALRGAVCGLGFGNIYLAFHEVVARLRARAARGPNRASDAKSDPRSGSVDRDEMFAGSDER